MQTQANERKMAELKLPVWTSITTLVDKPNITLIRSIEKEPAKQSRILFEI